MSYYEEIYERAADNYGIITSTDAREMGIPVVELGKLHSRGRLKRIGHGVYRIIQYIPTPLDSYANAVALVGRDAYLYGESVLAMHNLAPTNPSTIKIATPHTVRKTLPPYIVIVARQTDEQPTRYEGIRSQSVAKAIRSCRTTMMPERLLDAVAEARRLGLVNKDEAACLSGMIKNNSKTTKQ
jgi:predicted transcriptional regulator of viral defense system